MIIEVSIAVAAGEMKDLFSTPKSIELTRDILPDFDDKHKIIEIDNAIRMVNENDGLGAMEVPRKLLVRFCYSAFRVEE